MLLSTLLRTSKKGEPYYYNGSKQQAATDCIMIRTLKCVWKYCHWKGWPFFAHASDGLWTGKKMRNNRLTVTFNHRFAI